MNGESGLSSRRSRSLYKYASRVLCASSRRSFDASLLSIARSLKMQHVSEKRSSPEIYEPTYRGMRAFLPLS